MKMINLVLVLSFVGLSCSDDESDQTIYSGIVLDANSEQPLENVKVSLLGGDDPLDLLPVKSGTSDVNGEFVISLPTAEEVFAFNYESESPKYIIDNYNTNVIAIQNKGYNYDTLISFDAAYVKLIIPQGSSEQLNVTLSGGIIRNTDDIFGKILARYYSESYTLDVNEKEDIFKFFADGESISISWNIDDVEFSDDVPLQKYDTLEYRIVL